MLSMSGVATISIMGRVTEDVKQRTVNIKGDEKQVYDLCVAVNNYIFKKEHISYFNMTIWPGRYENMMKYMEKGKSIYVSGEFYNAQFQTETEAFWTIKLTGDSNANYHKCCTKKKT